MSCLAVARARWPTVAAAALLSLIACSGPRLLVAGGPEVRERYLDGRAVGLRSVPLPYYGTAQVDGIPRKPRHDGDNPFPYLPARTTAQWSEPVTPWLFPLDFLLECGSRLLHGRGDREVRAQVKPNADLAVPLAAPPGMTEMRQRAVQARVAR